MRASSADFIIVGAMKAGTTTLDAYLRRHPSVFMTLPKEPQFFSRDHVFARGLDWYVSLYEEAKPGQVRGEASTCYSRSARYPKTVARLVEAIPNGRFIYLMRHPVERAYSHYGHEMQRNLRDGRPVVTFEEFIETDDEVIDASMYKQQIDRFLEHFDEDRFLWLTFDELRRDPGALLERTQRFIGVEPVDLIGEDEVQANRRGDVITGRRITGALQSFRRLPVVRTVVDITPPGLRQAIRQTLANRMASSAIGRRLRQRFTKSLSPLTDKTRARLLDRFRQPTQELAEFLDRDLSAWLE